MTLIAILAGFLTGCIQMFTEAFTLLDQCFTTLGIRFHFFDGLLQQLTCFSQIFLFQLLLLVDFGELFISTLFAGFQLFDLNLEATEFRAQVGIGTLLLSHTASNFLTLCFQFLKLIFIALALSFQFVNLCI